MTTTQEAVALRQKLELDILALLQTYCDATGLTPASVDVQAAHVSRVGDPGRSIAITGVRVTVEL